ncbi:MAG: sugar ABC transporter substrate-binding protein [Rhodocyclaceae bacterium]|nr:MAG: sugar ABC transporter substrate-binding protein [Rhodocyclaceae bacterium]
MRRLFILLFLLLPHLAWSGEFSAVFINPGKSDEKYWVSVSRFMAAAAADLNIDLEVRYAERDHVRMIEHVEAVVRAAKKPDYLVIVNEKAAAPEMLRMADEAGIKTLVLLNRLDDTQTLAVGGPRGKFRHWIGSLTPDNTAAGYITAHALLQTARKSGHSYGPDGKLHLIAIAGDRSTPASVQRLQGLDRALREFPEIQLDQIVYGEWLQDRAKDQMDVLAQRYPWARTVWAANDLMAFGAMDSFRARGLTPGKDVFFSGINNSREALDAVIDGSLSQLAAGHFTAGGWAMVMLYDYHHGHDFADQGLELNYPLFTLIDARAAKRFLERFGEGRFDVIDFRRYSRALTHSKAPYAFGLEPLLR